MQRLYSPLAGVANPAADLEHLLSSHKVEQAVKEAIDKEYLNKENADQSEYTGTLLLVKDIITKYISQGIIPYDKRHNDFAIKGCEEKIYAPFSLSNSQKVEIGGIADRIDSLDSGALRVVD
jgi:ATP-dependent helicase/DNAse subunit B